MMCLLLCQILLIFYSNRQIINIRKPIQEILPPGVCIWPFIFVLFFNFCLIFEATCTRRSSVFWGDVEPPTNTGGAVLCVRHELVLDSKSPLLFPASRQRRGVPPLRRRFVVSGDEGGASPADLQPAPPGRSAGAAVQGGRRSSHQVTIHSIFIRLKHRSREKTAPLWRRSYVLSASPSSSVFKTVLFPPSGTACGQREHERSSGWTCCSSSAACRGQQAAPAQEGVTAWWTCGGWPSSRSPLRSLFRRPEVRHGGAESSPNCLTWS